MTESLQTRSLTYERQPKVQKLDDEDMSKWVKKGKITSLNILIKGLEEKYCKTLLMLF